MTAAGYGGPDPDLYQLLGVPREASREEIAQAWRHRARAEPPDARPRDAAAPGRFRVLAQAYQVLSDPVRRAAYDRAMVSGLAEPGAEVPVVRVQSPQRALAGDDWDKQEARLAVLALWYLAGERDRPW